MKSLPKFKGQAMLVSTLYPPFQINNDIDGGITIASLFLSNYSAFILRAPSFEQFSVDPIKDDPEPDLLSKLIKAPAIRFEDNQLSLSGI